MCVRERERERERDGEIMSNIMPVDDVYIKVTREIDTYLRSGNKEVPRQ